MHVRDREHDLYSRIRGILPEDAVAIIIDQLTTNTTLDLGLTEYEWLVCLQNRKVRNLLDKLDVPENLREDLVTICDSNGNGLITSAELQQGIIHCRGSSVALMVQDCKTKVQEVQEYLQTKMEKQMHIMHHLLAYNGKDMMRMIRAMLLEVSNSTNLTNGP